jgi:hypothetical protein
MFFLASACRVLELPVSGASARLDVPGGIINMQNVYPRDESSDESSRASVERMKGPADTEEGSSGEDSGVIVNRELAESGTSGMGAVVEGVENVEMEGKISCLMQQLQLSRREAQRFKDRGDK